MIDNIRFIRGGIDAGGAVSTAWEMVKANYLLYLGVVLLSYVLIGCIPCLNIFLMGPVLGGLAFFVLRDMRGEPVDFGMMFKGFEKFVPLMVVGLIQSVPGIIIQVIQYGVRIADFGLGSRPGRDFDFYQAPDAAPYLAGGMLIVIIVAALVLIVVSILWWVCFFFAIPLAMEYDLSPVDAIKLSARAGVSNIGGLIVLALLTFLVSLGGMLMLCIGIFLVSVPVIFVANVIVYRQVFPWVEQNFNMTPPPPNMYGNFGQGQ